jgi:hypothetical protein
MASEPCREVAQTQDEQRSREVRKGPQDGYHRSAEDFVAVFVAMKHLDSHCIVVATGVAVEVAPEPEVGAELVGAASSCSATVDSMDGPQQAKTASWEASWGA